MTTEVKDVVARLRTDAWYLRHRSHETLRTIGSDCDIAADLLDAAESRATAAEGRVALLEEALTAIRNAARKNKVDPDAIHEIAVGVLRARLAKGWQ